MHEVSYLALEILRELIRKSGVREWTDAGTRQSITSAAAEMATAIYLEDEAEAMSNELYIKTGTEVVFGSEVGDDVAWSSESVSNGAGRQSALYDQGADGTARPEWWRYRIFTQAVATPTVGGINQCYLKTSDGAHPDNDDGTSDAAVSAADKLKNLTPLNSPIVDEAAADVEFAKRGRCRIPERHFGIADWNGMGSATTADAAETKAIFTQIYDQSQA